MQAVSFPYTSRPDLVHLGESASLSTVCGANSAALLLDSRKEDGNVQTPDRNYLNAHTAASHILKGQRHCVSERVTHTPSVAVEFSTSLPKSCRNFQLPGGRRTQAKVSDR